jgi:signal transduction histidine kinase
MSSTLPLVAMDIAVVAVFLLLTSLAVRHRDRPGAVVAALLWLALGGMAAGLALGRVDIVAERTALKTMIVGWIVITPLWTGFVFKHTGRGPPVNSQWSAFAVGYIVLTVVTSLRGAALTGAIGQIVRVGTSILQTALIGVGLFGVFLVVRSTVTYNDLPRGQGVLLSISGLGISLVLFSTSTVSAFNPTTLPWTITGFLGVVAAAFAGGAFPYKLFGETPGAGPLARSSVLEEMSESVIVVDRDDRLVDANAAAERLLGVVVARDAGRPVRSVLGWDPSTVGNETTMVSTPNGRRLDASQSSLANGRGERIGTAFVFQDVTDQQTRKQRLEVLNRVLRHNLRNDLDAIRAFAEALSEGEVEEPMEIAKRIRMTSSDVVDIGTTVERAEGIMTRETLDVQGIDVVELVTDVADHVRTRYDCHIDIASLNDDGSGLCVTTDRGVLQTALIEVVENAVEHTDNEEPTVTIAVDSAEEGVSVAVQDQGPGIPAHERAVVVSGKETPLEHGTGVGLWFVSWAVTRLGGDLSFDDLDSGSRVLIELPDRIPESANGSY